MKELKKILKICDKKIISINDFNALLDSEIVINLFSLGYEGLLTNYRVDIIDPSDKLGIGSKYLQLRRA